MSLPGWKPARSTLIALALGPYLPNGVALGPASPRDAATLAQASLFYIATVRQYGDQIKAAVLWFSTTPARRGLLQTVLASWRAKRIRREPSDRLGRRASERQLFTQTANLLSASRFLLATAWLGVFLAGAGAGVLGPLAVLAAVSDLADGRVARRMNCADGLGRWLDGIADIVFIATTLSCEAVAGAIPCYIPVLVVVSFAQYAIDSILVGRSAAPVRSRLGHWGGILNFVLVIILGFAPPPRWPGNLIRRLSSLLAIYYLAAMAERALRYRPLPAGISLMPSK